MSSIARRSVCPGHFKCAFCLRMAMAFLWLTRWSGPSHTRSRSRRGSKSIRMPMGSPQCVPIAAARSISLSRAGGIGFRCFCLRPEPWLSRASALSVLPITTRDGAARRVPDWPLDTLTSHSQSPLPSAASKFPVRRVVRRRTLCASDLTACVKSPKKPLAHARGSANSAPYRAATVRSCEIMPKIGTNSPWGIRRLARTRCSASCEASSCGKVAFFGCFDFFTASKGAGFDAAS